MITELHWHSGWKKLVEFNLFKHLFVSRQGENQRLLTTSTCGHAPTALASKPTSAGNSSSLPTSVHLPLLSSLWLFFFKNHFVVPPLLHLPVSSMSLPYTPQSSSVSPHPLQTVYSRHFDILGREHIWKEKHTSALSTGHSSTTAWSHRIFLFFCFNIIIIIVCSYVNPLRFSLLLWNQDWYLRLCIANL